MANSRFGGLAGDGFSDNMRACLHSTGKAVAFEDLRDC